jgi:hypothetical protein
MRLIVFGLDANGGSCIASQSDLPFAPIPGLPGSKMAKLFRTDQSPPPPRPHGFGKTTPDTLAPGHVGWIVIDHEANADRKTDSMGMHNRNAIDMVVILGGGGEIGLSDGRHQVSAGDCILIGGIDHYTMRPGPQGCRAMSFAIGTPPPA